MYIRGTHLHIYKTCYRLVSLWIQCAAKPIDPIFTIIVLGIQVMEQMMIADQPYKPFVVSHHASYIEKEQDGENLWKTVGIVKKGQKGPYTLKDTLKPVTLIRIPHRWNRIFVMNAV